MSINVLYIYFMVSIALYNLKGGVGKTASTVNLAYLAAADGLKTLVWDLDPQGSSSFYLNVQPTTKNESRKLLTDEMELKDATQDCAFEKLYIRFKGIRSAVYGLSAWHIINS